MYRNIAVAVDNSECSAHAISLAADLARTTGAKLTGHHVYAARLHGTRFRQLEPGLPDDYQSEEVLQHWRDVHADLIGRGLKVISESYLDAFEQRCSELGVMAERKMTEGRNYEQLVKDTRESEYDLLLIGAHGLGRVDRSILGSVCERVTRLIDCDVMVVRHGRPLDSGALLVAIDGSPHSFAALRVALDLSRRYGSRVIAAAAYDSVFHDTAFRSLEGVLSDEAAKLFRFVEQEKLHHEVIDNGLARVYRAHLLEGQKMAKEVGVELEIQVLQGKPFDAVASFVNELRPSLLLVGRVGIHHGEGVTLGSTSESLLRLVDCNVLIIGR